MAGRHLHAAGTKYTCVDSHPDTLHGGHIDKDGYLFYLVEARCGSLKCPPYVEGRELVCVVCSKEWYINIIHTVFTSFFLKKHFIWQKSCYNNKSQILRQCLSIHSFWKRLFLDNTWFMLFMYNAKLFSVAGHSISALVWFIKVSEHLAF